MIVPSASANGDGGIPPSVPSERQRRAFLARLDEERRPPALTPRRVAGRVEFPGKATAVIGMRRAGKTTYLRQVRSERLSGGIPRERLPFVILEDERLRGLDATMLGVLIDEYTDRVLATGSDESQPPIVWFLDEVQVVPGWERLVRRLLDSGDAEVFVSGSSAALLSREIATELRGRAWQVLMHPFGFDEALRHGGDSLSKRPESMLRSERVRIEAAFVNWLEVGGFPEAQGLDAMSRRRLLSDYVDVALLRDVIDRHGITNVVGLRWLTRQLLANAGAMFSVEKFHRSLRSQGIAIARDTVHQHLGCLEDSFLVRTVWMEAASERQRMVNPARLTQSTPVLSVCSSAQGGRIGVTPLKRPFSSSWSAAGARSPMFELPRVLRWISSRATSTAPRSSFRCVPMLPMLRPPLESCVPSSRPVKYFPTHGKACSPLDRRGLPAEAPAEVHARPAYEWILAAAADMAG